MRAPRSAVCTSETFPAPPISKTKIPPGWRAFETARRTERRVLWSRRIQCRAALEKTLVNASGLSSGHFSKYLQSWVCHVRFGVLL